MKKKSLLILPVLLLALAACNKEEEVEEPEDNTPEVTEPTEPTEPGDQGGDDGEKEPIDTRIELAEGTRSFTGAESVTYENGAGLSISDPELVDGAITYYVSGTPNYMTHEQAVTFGGANVGDAYIILAIKLEEGETLHTSKDIPYSDTDNGVEDVIIGISGSGKGYKEYTVTTGEDEGEEVVASYVIDYKGVISIDRRIVLTTDAITMNGASFANPSDGSLYIDSIAVDGDNVTYYVKGTPSTMLCEGQATAFGGATVGDAYVVITITLAEGETLTWGEDKSVPYDASDYIGYIVIKVTNYASSVLTFTTGEGADAETVTHTVNFTGLTQPSTGDNGGDTGNDEP